MGVARFTCTLQLSLHSLQLPLSLLLDLRHPPSPNQHSCSPSPLASSMSSLVIITSYCPSLQTPTLFVKHAHHPSSTHACTIWTTIFFNPKIFIIIGPLSSFSQSVLHHTLLSPLCSNSRSFSKLPFHFPSNTVSLSHITSPILRNSDKPFLLSLQREPFWVQQLPTFHELHPPNSCFCCHSCLSTTTCIHFVSPK